MLQNKPEFLIDVMDIMVSYAFNFDCVSNCDYVQPGWKLGWKLTFVNVLIAVQINFCEMSSSFEKKNTPDRL